MVARCLSNAELTRGSHSQARRVGTGAKLKMDQVVASLGIAADASNPPISMTSSAASKL